MSRVSRGSKGVATAAGEGESCGLRVALGPASAGLGPRGNAHGLYRNVPVGGHGPQGLRRSRCGSAHRRLAAPNQGAALATRRTRALRSATTTSTPAGLPGGGRLLPSAGGSTAGRAPPRLVHSPGRRLPGGRSTLRHQIGGDAPHPTHPRRTRGARPTGARGTAYPTRWGSGVGHGGGDALPGDEGAPATAVGTRPGPTVHARRPAWGRFPARGRRGGVAPVGMPRTPTPSHAPHAMCPGDGVGYFPRTRTRTGPGLTSPGPVSCWGRSGGESLPV